MPSIAIRSTSQLVRLFEEAGRRSQFSRHAFEWLWDYLVQLEDDTGTPLEIDVVGLCCDYTEEDYDSIASSYKIDLPAREDFMDWDGDLDEARPDTFDADAYTEALRETILDYLRDNTVVLGYDDDSVLFASF
jgi:hypothetical protein